VVRISREFLPGIAGDAFEHPNTELIIGDAGETYCHASWVYHAGTEFGFDRMVQLGVRSGLREEFCLGRERCAFFSMDLDLPDTIRAELAAFPVYLTLDIDILNPAYAPAPAPPNPAVRLTTSLSPACITSPISASSPSTSTKSPHPSIPPPPPTRWRASWCGSWC
jgi:hypothetical protein